MFVLSPGDLREGLAGSRGGTFQSEGRVSAQALREV